MENLGLVGFTGAGANRLFSALTGSPAPSEYEAAVGVATVPDDRLDQLAAMSESKNVVHAGFELVHIWRCRRVPSPARGSGAKVLGALRNCDAILVVLRAFDDGGVAADPAGDLDALELELVMADLGERRAAARPAAAGREERRQATSWPRSGRSSVRSRRCRAGRRFEPREAARRRSRAPGPGVLPHDEADARRAQHG